MCFIFSVKKIVENIRKGYTLFEMMDACPALEMFIHDNWTKCNKAFLIEANRKSFIDRLQTGEFRITFTGRKVSPTHVPFEEEADDEDDNDPTSYKNIFKVDSFVSRLSHDAGEKEKPDDSSSSSDDSDDDNPLVIDNVDENERERIREMERMTQESLRDDTTDGTSSSQQSHTSESEPVTCFLVIIGLTRSSIDLHLSLIYIYIGVDTKKIIETEIHHGLFQGDCGDTDRKASSVSNETTLHLWQAGSGKESYHVRKRSSRESHDGNKTSEREGQVLQRTDERKLRRLRRQHTSRVVHGRIRDDGSATTFQHPNHEHSSIGRTDDIVGDARKETEEQEHPVPHPIEPSSDQCDQVRNREGCQASLSVEVGRLSDVGTRDGNVASRYSSIDSIAKERNDGHTPLFRLSRGFSTESTRGNWGRGGGSFLTDEENEEAKEKTTPRGRGVGKAHGFHGRRRKPFRVASDPTLSPITPRVRRWKRKRVVSPPPDMVE